MYSIEVIQNTFDYYYDDVFGWDEEHGTVDSRFIAQYAQYLNFYYMRSEAQMLTDMWYATYENKYLTQAKLVAQTAIAQATATPVDLSYGENTARFPCFRGYQYGYVKNTPTASNSSWPIYQYIYTAPGSDEAGIVYANSSTSPTLFLWSSYDSNTTTYSWYITPALGTIPESGSYWLYTSSYNIATGTYVDQTSVEEDKVVTEYSHSELNDAQGYQGLLLIAKMLKDAGDSYYQTIGDFVKANGVDKWLEYKRSSIADFETVMQTVPDCYDAVRRLLTQSADKINQFAVNLLLLVELDSSYDTYPYATYADYFLSKTLLVRDYLTDEELVLPYEWDTYSTTETYNSFGLIKYASSNHVRMYWWSDDTLVADTLHANRTAWTAVEAYTRDPATWKESLDALILTFKEKIWHPSLSGWTYNYSTKSLADYPPSEGGYPNGEESLPGAFRTTNRFYFTTQSDGTDLAERFIGTGTAENPQYWPQLGRFVAVASGWHRLAEYDEVIESVMLDLADDVVNFIDPDGDEHYVDNNTITLNTTTGINTQCQIFYVYYEPPALLAWTCRFLSVQSSSSEDSDMITKGETTGITFIVKDRTTGEVVTGDAANLTCYVVKSSYASSSRAAATYDPVEVTASSGIYFLKLTESETNCDFLRVVVTSSTANAYVEEVELEPINVDVLTSTTPATGGEGFPETLLVTMGGDTTPDVSGSYAYYTVDSYGLPTWKKTGDTTSHIIAFDVATRYWKLTRVSVPTIIFTRTTMLFYNGPVGTYSGPGSETGYITVTDATPVAVYPTEAQVAFGVEYGPSGDDYTGTSVFSDVSLDSIADAVVTGISASPVITRMTPGMGSTTYVYTLTEGSSTAPIMSAIVYVYNNVLMELDNLVASGITDEFGQVTFYLNSGTYYFKRVRAGYTFTNPDVEVVS